MLDLDIEKRGDIAIVQCKGRIVRSEAAFKLHRAVTSLGDSRILVLDLSRVSAIEGGGLGMLRFLQRWACDHQIQLKLFNPRKSVRDRLGLVSSFRSFDISSLHELMSLLAKPDRSFALVA